MCGIVGSINLTKKHPISEARLRQMLAMIRHRGPDQFGLYLDDEIGMGSARLSIIDLGSGQQPISNEDESLWIVFNGEIFNYVELRPELEARGHRFKTNSDTEVILHLFEELGADCFNYLNGQFAIAIWDARSDTLTLARDRLGIRPLYYTVADGALVFGSEIKAMLVDPRVEARIDPIALDQIFNFWSPLSPRTIFEGIVDLPPGSYMEISAGDFTVRRYWKIQFPLTQPGAAGRAASHARLEDHIEVFRDLLIDAAKIRLRADVPVGAYLSGGLDSSTIAAIIRNFTGNRLDTFSITFSDPEFDEGPFQRQMAEFLGTDHQVVHATHEDIGRVFPSVIWHTESPILRTSPAPLFLLSELVRENHYKVVLTGEGADEFLAGYNIFKEASIRRFWARDPQSDFRPLLLQRLYPYITDLTSGSGAYLKAFFQKGLEDTKDPFYSHRIRWSNTQRTKRFFTSDVQAAGSQRSPAENAIPLPPEYHSWDPLNQAQYLEISIFLAQYLLSSQGDRMAMAHSVEGRFPFLDHRVVEYSNFLPTNFKLNGLMEKYILKKVAQDWLPEEIWRRPKRPYRAPIHRSFFSGSNLDYVTTLLSEETVSKNGLFNPAAVLSLIRKIQSGKRLSETDDMALVGILSTQLVVHQFIDELQTPAPISAEEDVKVIHRSRVRHP